MDLLEGISKPAEREPLIVHERSGGRNSWVWALIALALFAACSLLLYRLHRVELQVAGLDGRFRTTERRLTEVEGKSEDSLRRASEAEVNARQAAQQRDQAQKAQAESEKETQRARDQVRSAQSETALAEQKAEQLRKQREQELASLQQTLSQIAETRRTAMGLVMTLGSNSIRFDFDKADLRPENREILSRIAGVLMTLKGYNIYVYGYTDDVGSQEYNQGLSERRAATVREYLVHAGLDSKIISARGYGKTDPRVAGNTSGARAVNRRVEIGIVDSRLRFDALPPGQ
jgi:outer membrane protein OmpA-like peptidoglycan-associated protein